MWKILTKKSTYQPPEYRQFLRLRIITFSIVGLIGLSLLVGIFFIYNNIYTTIGSAEQIIWEKNGLASLETIDFVKFEKIIETWQAKNNPSDIILNRDPFNSPAISTSTIISTD